MVSHILSVFYGMVFGIANVIPGVSGGTMLVVFGCYDKVCGALALDFKEIKKNPVARAVKLADLKHNSDMSRLDTVTPYDITRAKKYKRAIALLEEDA